MRRTSTTFLVAAALAACQPEYGITDAYPVFGAVNPAPVEQPIKTDRIVQVIEPINDVLWIIDNSSSMLAEQEGLTENFSSFIGYFLNSNVDYHIGVVSTDMNDEDHSGKLQRDRSGSLYISNTTPSALTSFEEMALMGTDGHGSEKGRAAAYTALELLKDGYNSGFYRDEGTLSIIAVSDEDDQSQNDPIGLNDFIIWLSELKPEPGMVDFSSIVHIPKSECASGVEKVGEQYLAVTEAIGGIEWSICTENWTEVLNLLGLRSAGLRQEFFLSDVPVAETIRVWAVEPKEEGGQTLDFIKEVDYRFSVTRNSISFRQYVPPTKTEIFIEYDLLSAQSGDREVDSGL